MSRREVLHMLYFADVGSWDIIVNHKSVHVDIHSIDKKEFQFMNN